jgi:branched-chain amino acid transport system permease protein
VSTVAGRPVWRLTVVRHLAGAVLALGALYLVTQQVDEYRNLQIATVAYTAIAVGGLTVLCGTSGQISLGQGAFMAVGAYTTAVILNHQDWNIGWVIAISTVGTALFGAVVGAAAARLRGPYLAGATLALAVGLPSLANYRHLRGTLGGANGLTVAPKPPPLSLGETFPLERWQAWICGLCTVIVFVALANLLRSKIGQDMRALRDDEIAASLSGVRVARVQVVAFVVAAACAGMAGSLLAFVTSLAAPGAFPLALSLSLLTAAVLGGLGSLAGAVYGSILVVLLPTWSSGLAESLSLPRDVYSNLPLIVYGAVLILVMLLFPRGLQGALRLAVSRVRPRGSREGHNPGRR